MEQTGEKQMQKEERNMTGRHYRKTTNFIPPHCSENNSTTTHVRRRSFRLALCLFFALILLTPIFCHNFGKALLPRRNPIGMAKCFWTQKLPLFSGTL